MGNRQSRFTSRHGRFLQVCIVLLIAWFASAQDKAQPPQSPSIQLSQADSGVFTFRAASREVILDLIALNGRGGPVTDLADTELRVSYSSNKAPARKHSHPYPQIAPITSLDVVDPNAPLSSAQGAPAGFQITASCLERSTVHYQLAFRPGVDGWTSGFHQISVFTTRRGVQLFYRHRYFVGKTVAPPEPPVTGPEPIKKLLMKYACDYPDIPLSISLRAGLIDTGRSDVLRYQVALDAASLSYAIVNSETSPRQSVGVDRRVQLDYAVCAFNASGRPIAFYQASLDQILNSAEYARALDRDFPHVFDIPALPSAALTRIVVRDRATGNVGAINMPVGTRYSGAASASSVAHIASGHGNIPVAGRLDWETIHDLKLFQTFRSGAYVPPPEGPIGSFGAVVPAANSICGDVYELEHSSPRLPDFRELDPIGSLYTYSLDVPSQEFTNTKGIPGVAPRTNLFGIDYHAVFWVRNTGEYQFRMVSDDGAKLWIDDRRLIKLDGIHPALGGSGQIYLDAGPHTLHVPYYQGAVVSVALLLWVQPPGQTNWRIFDVRDFAPPNDSIPRTSRVP